MDKLIQMAIKSGGECWSFDQRSWMMSLENLAAFRDAVLADAGVAALKAERDALREALDCLLAGACAVAVPHAGERAVLQSAVDQARAAIAAGGRT